MLSQTLDEIMTRAKKFEHLTRATKFSSAFKGIDLKEKDEQIMQRRISRYSKKVLENDNTSDADWQIENIIIENPDEIKVDIEFKNNNGKPFFKSIREKLEKKLQYQGLI